MHSEVSQTNTVCYHLYVEYKKNQMNITERLTDTVNKPLLNKLVVTGWKREEGKGMIVVGDKKVQTTMHKISYKVNYYFSC